MNKPVWLANFESMRDIPAKRFAAMHPGVTSRTVRKARQGKQAALERIKNILDKKEEKDDN